MILIEHMMQYICFILLSEKRDKTMDIRCASVDCHTFFYVHLRPLLGRRLAPQIICDFKLPFAGLEVVLCLASELS